MKQIPGRGGRLLPDGRVRADAGMTLIEIVFASGIVATGLSIMFGYLLSMNTLGQLAEGRTTAAIMLSSVVEEIRTMGYEEMLVFSPNPLECEGIDMAVVLEAFDEQGNAVELPVAQGNSANLPQFPNPMEVRATILWSKGSSRIFSLSTSTFYGR